MSIKINLGSGSDVRPGWLNVDLAANADIQWDLSKGLPPDIDDLEEVGSSHMLEHISNQEAQTLLNACHSKMIPGGKIRLCLPDIRKACIAYLANDIDFFAPLQGIYSQGYNPATASIVDYLDYAGHQPTPEGNEHKSVWDIAKAMNYLSAAGFREVRESSFDKEQDYDNHLRIKYSIYVEAIK